MNEIKHDIYVIAKTFVIIFVFPMKDTAAGSERNRRISTNMSCHTYLFQFMRYNVTKSGILANNLVYFKALKKKRKKGNKKYELTTITSSNRKNSMHQISDLF